MDSNSNHQRHQLQHQPNSGLLRFRSAPTSLLGSEPERLTLRFLNSSDKGDKGSLTFREFEDKKHSKPPNQSLSLSRMNSQQQGYSGLRSYYPRHSSAMDSSYGLAGSTSMGMNHEVTPKSFSWNLPRQSSFPAFSNISFQNVNGSDGELSPSMTRLKNQISFSLGSPSSLGTKAGNGGFGAISADDGRKGGSKGDARSYGPGFPYSSWIDGSHLSENFRGLKREQSSVNETSFSDAQSGGLGNQVHILSHHLSLPNTSADMVAVENLFQFPDSVPCKIRARRGCATHPRSIAERVRRSRISERMKKLQELVPNMDRQTNTAEMLDCAVQYIKDLQQEFKTLAEKRANCKCVSMLKSDTDQISGLSYIQLEKEACKDG